jgi:hypothetical protein
MTSIFGNSTSTEAYKNGSAVTLTNSAAMPTLSFNGIYAIGYYNSTATLMRGNIQEMIFYTSDQTSNRTAIEGNINTYYSIF